MATFGNSIRRLSRKIARWSIFAVVFVVTIIVIASDASRWRWSGAFSLNVCHYISSMWGLPKHAWHAGSRCPPRAYRHDASAGSVCAVTDTR